MAHASPSYLFEEMEQVSSDSCMALDKLIGQVCVVPDCDLFAMGIECDTISAANRAGMVGQGVMEHGIGVTGESVAYCLGYVRNHHPALLLVECVKNLGATSEKSAIPRASDLDVLIGRLNNEGYTVHAGILSPLSYGVPQSRPRYYMLGFLTHSPNSGWNQLAEDACLPACCDSAPLCLQKFQIPSKPVDCFLPPPGP